jgi:hypothetical protein
VFNKQLAKFGVLATATIRAPPGVKNIRTVINLPTFRKNVLPRSSGYKRSCENLKKYSPSERRFNFKCPRRCLSPDDCVRKVN